MIEKIELENFKCFKAQMFDFKNLTIFCGANSSGKSTIIQSLLLLKQSYNRGTLEEQKLALTGPLFDFGSFQDVFKANADSERFGISINDFRFSSTYEQNKKYAEFIALDEADNNREFTDYKKLSIFKNDFVYLSAGRYGPVGKSDIPHLRNEALDIGIYGEYALYEYEKRLNEINSLESNKFAYQILFDTNQYNSENTSSEFSFKALVKALMERVYPSYDMTTSKNSRHRYIEHNFVQSSMNLRPNNIGFGVSCVLPIIIACCCIKEGGTLIVENPEIHLHPKAQSELVKILALLANSGVQVIIETHSDHIINGLRVFIKKEAKELADKTIIYSISKFAKSDNDIKVQEIFIDENGSYKTEHDTLDNGFFDQIKKDFLELI